MVDRLAPMGEAGRVVSRTIRQQAYRVSHAPPIVYPTPSLADVLMPFVMGLLLAFLLATNIFHTTPAINCPQEDACYADYHDGAWHIYRKPEGSY